MSNYLDDIKYIAKLAAEKGKAEQQVHHLTNETNRLREENQELRGMISQRDETIRQRDIIHKEDKERIRQLEVRIKELELLLGTQPKTQNNIYPQSGSTTNVDCHVQKADFQMSQPAATKSLQKGGEA